MPRALIAFSALILVASPSAAQVTHHTPYAGLESREIKALSAEEVRQLLEGEGMGLALAAELNGLPGPLHVLELADSLALTAAQRESVEAIFAEMKASAVALGREVVERERELDRAFAGGEATPDRVRELTGAIGRLRGSLRAAHLEAHLSTAAALDPGQVHRYRMLRGYHGGGHGQGVPVGG